jgi:hypothetical protein
VENERHERQKEDVQKNIEKARAKEDARYER